MEKRRRLFCEISPFTYKISTVKCIALRSVKDLFTLRRVASKRQSDPLPELVCSHKSLIRRKLGDVDAALQENKAVNLAIAAPKVSGILVRPGETFSFWSLVGSCTAKKGYRDGLTLCRGTTSQDVGGGMCQFTNLIHWMVLHSPLTITEHHHHDGVDMFPDFGRQVPFGTGTAVLYNYLDYRIKNETATTYQLLVYTDERYLCGELRADTLPEVKYHIKTESEYFTREPDGIFRNNSIYRECVDRRTGNMLARELIKQSHARVMYDESFIPDSGWRDPPFEKGGRKL